MADQAHMTEQETAEMAFRRIARRKLLERGVAEDQIESKIDQLLRRGATLRVDVDTVLGSNAE